MTSYVIDPAAALRIVEEDVALDPAHGLLAPTLLRSQVLSHIYGRVRDGEIGRAAGLDLAARFDRLKLRYLGDRALRRAAWDIAEEIGADTTYMAEFIALTRLQADALVAEDPDLAASARDIVTVAAFDDLRA